MVFQALIFKGKVLINEERRMFDYDSTSENQLFNPDDEAGGEVRSQPEYPNLRHVTKNRAGGCKAAS